MVKQFFTKILCLLLGLSIFAPQVAYTTAQSSPAVLFRNKDHFEPEQSAGDKFQNLGREEFTDANNHASDYDYDALGWLSKVINPLGYVTKHTYDANGNIIKTERQADALAAAWQATEFTYDILNKLKTVKDPLNRVTTYNYDNNENLASVVDAEGNTTSYVYDERDLLFTVTDANTPAGVTAYDYDLNGNLARIKGCLGNPSYNLYIHVAPVNDGPHEHFHWHIKIVPKLMRTVGLERGTGFFSVPTDPGHAARYLREAAVPARR